MGTDVLVFGPAFFLCGSTSRTGFLAFREAGEGFRETGLAFREVAMAFREAGMEVLRGMADVFIAGSWILFVRLAP